MGSCSNRSLTKNERLANHVKEIARCRDISDFNWQISTGAKIRGELGVEKGNDFIKAIKKATK